MSMQGLTYIFIYFWILLALLCIPTKHKKPPTCVLVLPVVEFIWYKLCLVDPSGSLKTQYDTLNSRDKIRCNELYFQMLNWLLMT